VRLVRGDFAGARADCAQLAAAGGAGAAPGFTCLAQAVAGGGDLDRARELLDSVPEDPAGLDPAMRAYLLATRAELRERSRGAPTAIGDYREALALAPDEDSIRAALADALAAAGKPAEARQVLAVDKPGLPLLVRSAALFDGARRAELTARAGAWLELEAARGDAIHYRELAMLALVSGDAAQALAAARQNFEVQKELADVRVFARAARAARDESAMSALREWLLETGYRDVTTEGILDGRPRS
jgi:tetratricopeptide (TPR) repeat protein